MYKILLIDYFKSALSKWFYQYILLIILIANGTPVFSATDHLLLAKVTVDEAVRNVSKNQKNRVLGAKTETIEGREVHVIKTLSEKGRIRNRRVDAETGRAMKKNRKR
jgi:hypothetical protein